MGCDIHCNIEVRENGAWRKHAPLVPNRYFSKDHPQSEYNMPMIPDEGLSDPDYNVFAILADVRNGHGFAGIKTGEGFNIIAQPKGLPDDCDPAIREESEKWGVDGHSHSFLTLHEILAFDWEQIVQQQGYVSEDEYQKWDKKSEPDSYCGGVGGRDIISLTEADYLATVGRDGRKAPGKEYYILVTWVHPYREAVGKGFWNSIERLKGYAAEFGGDENVRLVFWFDN